MFGANLGAEKEGVEDRKAPILQRLQSAASEYSSERD